MLSTPKAKGELFLASSLCDGLEDNNIKQVTTLLESKDADPNVLLPLHGITPFHLVIGNESELFAEKVTKLFLRHGGNPNVKSIDGMTPVHVAAAWGRVKVLELLLANGGDPLCLDDDGRSPFHYAFDGSYYDAITVLGKYCSKSKDEDEGTDDDDEEEDENEPKIKIKLEKILVNRGDVIAEYVPSEIDLTNDTQYETKENIVSVEKLDYSLADNVEHKDQSSSSSTEMNSNFSDESLNLSSNNITYRRGKFRATKHNEISPILGVDNFNFDLKKGNVAEEKLLIGQIIRRLSNSLNISSKKLRNINVRRNMVKNDNAKKFSSLLPQPKYFKNNLNLTKKAIKSGLLDTSIVSTSPNFKIPLKKNNIRTTPTCRQKDEFSSRTKKQFTSKKSDLSPTTIQSSSAVSSQIKSASSTPKRKTNLSKYGLQKLSTNKKRDQSPIKTPLGRTDIENIYDIRPSPETECKISNREKLYKNIARKLDNTMYDEDVETDPGARNSDNDQWNQLQVETKSPDIRSKFTKLFNNVDTKTILGITKIKSGAKQIKPPKPKIEQDEKSQIIGTSISNKYESNRAFLESPGSSRPTSACYQYQSIKNEFDSNDEMEIWNEINSIYADKGQTPPASISKLINESLTSLNSSRSYTSTEKGDATFSTENTGDNFAVHVVDQQNSISSDDEEKSSQCTNTEDYRTPMRSFISSRSSLDSFVSVDEEYAYVDAEKDVAFMERRLLVLPKVEDMNRAMYESTWLNRHGELSSATSQISPRTSGEFDRIFNRGEFLVSNASLRHQLIALGEAPGPITDTTHYVYLKRLYKLKRGNTMNLNECIITTQSRNETIPKSPTISKILLSTDWITNLQFYRDLEELAFREYERPNDKRKYRGGMAKTSFNYLLLDPRVTKDLPRKGRDLCLAERWKIFLKAIFYVGKGKNARPFQHLYESHKIWTGRSHDHESTEKVQRILNIWRDGKGVICHQVFINSMQEEAFTREAAMIDALGTNHLSNCQSGHYYGLAATMNREEKKALGKFLLYKAMEILMHDGERQQFPRNIE